MTQPKPLSQVNHQAIRVLCEQLGVVDTFRFVSQFTTGYGNYTKEREVLFGHLTLEDITSAIEKKRPRPLPDQAPNSTGEKPAS